MTGTTKGVAAHNPQSYASLERIAVHVRARLLPGHSDLEPVPGLELFERLDEYTVTVRGASLRLQYAVEDLPTGLEAQAYYSTDETAIVVALTEDSYEALSAGAGRALFTVAHEIGHAVLHPLELVERRVASADARALHRGTVGGHKAFMDTEWQANGFAGAMLVPAAGLAKLEASGQLDARSIARTYLVSQQAAELRLKVFVERREELLG
jgi:IrrE N-terminal-like domain